MRSPRILSWGKTAQGPIRSSAMRENPCSNYWKRLYSPHHTSMEWGKIDRILSDNPEWHFVFVISVQRQNSTLVVGKNKQYECEFQVILDVDHEFEKKYHLENYLANTFVMMSATNKLFVQSVKSLKNE